MNHGSCQGFGHRWCHFTQLRNALGGAGGEEESRVCLGYVQSLMPTGHPSEHVTWINETGFQIKTEDKIGESQECTKIVCM